MLLNRSLHGFGGCLRVARLRAALLGLGWGVALAAGPGVWGQAPQVASVTPANGATGVGVTTPLVFVFDQVMAEVPVFPTIPGFFVGNLEVTPAGVPILDCEWSEDLRTLACTPTADFPANTTVNWKLNPAGTLFPMENEAGVALATTSGSFATGAGSGGGGGGGNDEEPVLVSSSPADGALSVPVTATVQFVFDRAMKKTPGIGGAPPFAVGAVQWAGSGLDAAKFTYAWSEDGKTLTAEYAGDLPGTTEVSWVLNPALGVVKLESEEGVALPGGEYSGVFTTGAGTGGGGGDCDPDGVPSTWGFYTVSKMLNFVQSSANEPTAAMEDAFSFGAVVTSPQAGPAVTAAQVTVPPNTSKPLEGVPIGGFWVFNDPQSTSAELNTAYPGGAYTLRFTRTGEAERAIAMTMPGATPPVPRIANYAEAQAVVASQAFTLRWNAFTGASDSDSLNLSIRDQSGVVFDAPDPCVPRELAVTATSIVIPANTLADNKTYHATLSFSDGFYFSTNTVSNMAGFGVVSTSTEFTIITGTGGGPGPAVPARFTAYALLDNGRAQMTLTGTADRTYTIERATRIGPGDWQTAGTVLMGAGGTGTFEDPQPAGVLPRFYRAVAN